MSCPSLSGRSVRPSRITATALATAIGLLVLAPDFPARGQSSPPAEECNEFATVVNQNKDILAEFEQDIDAFSEDASQAETLQDITAAAAAYVSALDGVTDDLAGLTANLEAVAFTDNQLTSYRDDYVAVVTDIGAALEVLSQAMNRVAESASEAELLESLETVNAEAQGVASEIETLSMAESEIVDSVNAYCGAGQSE